MKFEKGDRVRTIYGPGTIIGREIVNDNFLFPKLPPKMVLTNRWAVELDNPPWDQNPLYFWSKDLSTI